jgi:hypothetical protein
MERMITQLGRLIGSLSTPTGPKCMGKLGQREQTLPSISFDRLLAEAAQEAQIVLFDSLGTAPPTEFAYEAVVIQQKLRWLFGPLHPLDITKEILGCPQSRAEPYGRKGAIPTEIEGSAAGNPSLYTREKNPEHCEQAALGFPNAPRIAKHHRLVVKLSDARGAVDLLKSVESDRVAIVRGQSVKNKGGSPT